MDPNTVPEVDRVPHGGSDDPTPIDFSVNTNPETPEGVAEQFRTALSTARSYPPDPPAAFQTAAAEYVGCDPDQIVPTPGGLAAIRLAIATTVDSGDSVLLPKPSFGEYAREVQLQGGTPAFVAHDAVVERDPAPHALVVLCQPNNPTGTAYDPDAVEAFADRCRAEGTTLLLDEAFIDFTERRSLAGTEGVIVARSLTKVFGLPGLRAGFAVATGAQRRALRTARRPWNVGGPALAVGRYCLRQQGFVDETRARVRSERDRMRAALEERFDIPPSEAPFLLLNVGAVGVETVLSQAAAGGLTLRDATTFRGLDQHVRVAVRRPTENDRLIDALAEF